MTLVESTQPLRILFCGAHTDPQPWLDGLRAALPQAQVEVWQPGAAPAHYALVWMPPQQLFDEQPELQAIFNLGAGVDALLRLRLPAQARVVRLEDAGMAVQMAEFVCQAVIRHFRDLNAYDADLRAGHWTRYAPRRRADYPVGVMGLGVLGARVVQALSLFEFPVNGWSRSPKTLPGVNHFCGWAQWPDFLAASRVLVNLLPLTPETTDLLNRDSLSRLRPGGYVINVARGAHLVDDDLLALIHSGHLAGAALDVFRTEPLPAEHPFWREPTLTLTPHTSARTLTQDSITQIVGKVAAMARGQKVSGEVAVVRGY